MSDFINMPKRTRQKQKGFSFVELNVAIALFLTAAVAIAGILLYSARCAKKATELAQCINLAKAKMAECIYMKANEIDENIYPAPFSAPFENYKYTIQKLTPQDPNISSANFKELKISVRGISGTRFDFIGLLTRPFSWARTYETGGNNPPDGYGYCVQQTSDGGYIIAGSANPVSLTGRYAWLLKINSDGSKTEWEKIYKPAGYLNTNGAMSVQKTADNEYIAAIAIPPFAYISKVNIAGNCLWTKNYPGGMSSDDFRSVQQTADGGYVAAGQGYYNGFIALRILKIDRNGTKIWQKIYGSNGSYARSIIETRDGKNIIVAGSCDTTSSGANIIILKLKSDTGELVWGYKFDFANDYGFSVKETNDRGYIVSGTIKNAMTGFGLIMKLDSEGSIKWKKAYAGISALSTSNQAVVSNSETPICAIQSADGGYVIGCTYNNQFCAIKLKPDTYEGAIEWQKIYAPNWPAARSALFSVLQTSDEGYIMTGYAYNGASNANLLWVVKTDLDGTCPPLDNNINIQGPIDIALAQSVASDPYLDFGADGRLLMTEAIDTRAIITKQAP